MTIGQEFKKEVEEEFTTSRRLIERVPSDRAQWKPHPKSSALGHLTQFVCLMPKIMSDIVHGVDLDLAAGPGYTFETTETLLRALRRERRRAPSDAVGGEGRRLRRRVAAYAPARRCTHTAVRKDALRNTINHFVHHRGQLTVYLRLLDVPIPPLYGPTADEPAKTAGTAKGS